MFSGFRTLVLATLIGAASAALATDRGASLPPDSVLSGATDDMLTAPRVKFIMQHDCNLVVYHDDRPVWATNTNGKGDGCRAIMQRDGNLVVYRGGDNKVIWDSGTFRFPGGSVTAQTDGNVVIYQGGAARWSTKTARLAVASPVPFLRPGPPHRSPQPIDPPNGTAGCEHRGLSCQGGFELTLERGQCACRVKRMRTPEELNPQPQ